MRRIALAVGLISAALTAAPAGATMPGKNGLIAYSVYTGGGQNSPATYAIYTVSPNGGTPKLLINNAKEPAWSPDGSQIAFTRTSPTMAGHTDVWVAKANGTGAKRILTNASNPTWSPSGRQIAYIYDFGSAYVASSTGKKRRAVADGNMTQGVEALDWAPTGNTLVYSLVDQLAIDEYVKIYTVSSTGKNSTLLIANSSPGSSSSVSAVPLSWSPNGQSIATIGITATAAQVMNTSGEVAPPGSAGPVIALMSMPGASPITYLSIHAGGADWSPDGTALCALSINGLELVNPTAQTSTVLVPHTPGFVTGQDCDWQPLPS